jgi:hypothetical protein
MISPFLSLFLLTEYNIQKPEILSNRRRMKTRAGETAILGHMEGVRGLRAKIIMNAGT